MAAVISSPAPQGIRLPTEDDLPYSDGVPMDSQRQYFQMNLFILTLNEHWKDREDIFIGGNMFVYFSSEQLRGREFRGPDVLVVKDVPRRERKSWVVWEEGKGPDVVIELLSESTAAVDRTEKKQVYQDRLRVPEYFWFDPETGELAGFRLEGSLYQALTPDADGHLVSQELGLTLVKWSGVYEGIQAVWLRWATPDGVVLPTPNELAEQERLRAEKAEQRAERLAAKLRALGIDPDA
jgi:Uma2 family endonuclease